MPDADSQPTPAVPTPEDPWRVAARETLTSDNIQPDIFVLPPENLSEAELADPARMPCQQYYLNPAEAASWLGEYIILADDVETHDEALASLDVYETELTDLCKLAGALHLGGALLRIARGRMLRHAIDNHGNTQAHLQPWLETLVMMRSNAMEHAAQHVTPDRLPNTSGSTTITWLAFTDLLRYSFDDQQHQIRPIHNETILRLNALYVAMALNDDAAIGYLIDESLLMDQVGQVVLMSLNRLAWGTCNLFTDRPFTIAETIAQVRKDTSQYLDLAHVLQHDSPGTPDVFAL